MTWSTIVRRGKLKESDIQFVWKRPGGIVLSTGSGTYSADTSKAVPLFQAVRLSCVKCRTTFQAYKAFTHQYQ